METIRKYMESLFVNLPNTPEVKKAKEHLLEMAEDKYISLKEEGVSDNEAVAKVISEFGNLDELKDELGIAEEVNRNSEDAPTRVITEEETRAYVSDRIKAAFMCGIGVMCFICCVVPPVVIQSENSPVGLFLLVGIGVVLQILQASMIKKWDFIEKEKVSLDAQATEYVKEEKRKKSSIIVLARTIGIMLCVICVVPSIVLRNDWGAAGLFVFVGAGVFMIVTSTIIERVLSNLFDGAHLNSSTPHSRREGGVVYDNPNLAAIMDIYWKLVVCFYLSVSFLSHAWGSTWVIFVIAAIVKKCIEGTKGHEE